MDARTARPDTKAMLRLFRLMGRYSDWRMVALAGVLGFVLTLAIMVGINVVSVSLSTLSIALAAALGSLLAGAWSARLLRGASAARCASRTCASMAPSTT
jgi:hypothetical protein